MASNLETFLHNQDLPRKYAVLALVAAGEEKLMPKDIKEAAINAGLRKAKNWNVSALLGHLDNLVARYADGWAATAAGKDKLKELGLDLTSSPTTTPQIKLRAALHQVSDESTRGFLEEAVKALEFGLHRSAVVLSWVGAVATLHQVVVDNHLADFNKELIARKPKAKPIKIRDDLGSVSEYDLLQICKAIGLFGKNIKEELEGALKLRNGCGHPTGVRPKEHRVASHIETLVQYVYEPLA
ncbi:MAG: hypothetical protein ACX93N_03190 [Pseudohaliea sp.]